MACFACILCTNVGSIAQKMCLLRAAALHSHQACNLRHCCCTAAFDGDCIHRSTAGLPGRRVGHRRCNAWARAATIPAGLGLQLPSPPCCQLHWRGRDGMHWVWRGACTVLVVAVQWHTVVASCTGTCVLCVTVLCKCISAKKDAPCSQSEAMNAL